MAKKWDVTAHVYGSKFLGTFEADTAEEAIQKAYAENGHVSVCHQCSHEINDPELGEAEATEAE